MTPLLPKLGVKEGMRTAILKAPAELADLFAELRGHSTRLSGNFDCIHLFAVTREEFLAIFPEACGHLNPGGMLWASWPKGGGMGTDLTLMEVIRLGYDFGMVESKCISLDARWSALKFTLPKPGKTYHNSYGRLR